jgi:hypothetical protein
MVVTIWMLVAFVEVLVQTWMGTVFAMPWTIAPMRGHVISTIQPIRLVCPWTNVVYAVEMAFLQGNVTVPAL